MLLSAEADGSLRLRPYRAVAAQSRGLFRGLAGGSMVDELLSERRMEVELRQIRAMRRATRPPSA